MERYRQEKSQEWIEREGGREGGRRGAGGGGGQRAGGGGHTGMQRVRGNEWGPLIKKGREDRGEGWEKARGRRDQTVFTHRDSREKPRWGGRRWMDGGMEGGMDGWMDGGTGASLTDLLTRTQGGTSASLTQQHTCQSCRFFHKFSHLNSCGRRTQKATVKFRAEFPLKWLCKGYLSLKVALEFPWTEKLFSCGDCPVIIFKFTVHKIAFFSFYFYVSKKADLNSDTSGADVIINVGKTKMINSR